MVDAPLVTLLILDFFIVPPLCRTDCFKSSFFNRIVPMWNSLPSNARHITNYSAFISSLKHLMFEKINTSFVSSDCWSWFFSNVCVVIAGCHNHLIIKGWWKLKKYVGWELLAKDPV